MKRVKKLMAALLALLILSSTGCGGDTSWAYESDGIRIPAGLYINFMMYATQEMIQEEIDAHADDSEYTQPEAKDFLKQQTDGVSNQELVKRKASVLAGEYILVQKQFDELGLRLEEADVDAVRNYVDSIWTQNREYFDKNGIGRESLELFQMNELRKEQLFTATYGAGGAKAVPDDELKQAFQDEYAKIEVMFINDSAAEEGQETDISVVAEDYYNRYKNGESIAALDYEYRMSMAPEDEKESIVENEQDSYVQIVHTHDIDPDEILVRAIREAALGDIELILDESIYYLFKRLDILEDPADFEDYRESIIYEMKVEEFSDDLRLQAEGVAMQANQPAVNRYTPGKIKFEAA